jgi:NAD(P)-dependent dehydrogenase (short-subunit alcohol dehydrogenase family)
MRLKEKVAIITAGGTGIGAGISQAFAREGADLVITYRTQKAATNEVARELRAAGRRVLMVRADLTKSSARKRLVERVVEAFGRIDILVNCAGTAPFVDFLEATESLWDHTFAVNAKSVFFLGQDVARTMIERRIRGRIVNVTSISGEKATSPLQTIYCTSKAAANMATKVMAVALAPHGITVNAVLPGTIPTGLNEAVLNDGKTKKAIVSATPLRALGEPQHVAEAVLMFAEDVSDWTTGSLLVVDGGFIA